MKTVRLQHLAKIPITNGLGLPGEHNNPEWPRYVRTTDIADPRSLRDDVFASQPPEVAAQAPLVRNDIVACAAGATIGKSSLYLSDEPACYAGFLVRIRPADDVDPRFLGHWMQSKHYWAQIDQGAVRSTIDNFSASKYRSLMAPDLALDEQRRIADFLDDRVARIDQIIAARQQQVDSAEQAFASLRRQAALGQSLSRQPTDLPWASSIPSGWTVRRLRQLASMGTGHTPSRLHADYWVNCDIPWLTTADVHKFRHDEVDRLAATEFQISELGLQNSAAVLHPAGTVALSRTASAGFAIQMGCDMATSQDYVTWTCGPGLLPEYLLQLLRVMRSYLLRYLAVGSTHKTIYFPDLMDLRIPLPSVAEQGAAVERIAAAQAVRLQLVDGLRRQIALLQEYKQSLITAAVTGEFDVTTASTKIPE